MTHDFDQEQHGAIERFAQNHKFLTAIGLIGVCALTLEMNNVPAVAGTYNAAKFIVDAF